MSEQKELDADPKAIQQIKFVGKLKKLDDDDDDGYDDDDRAEINVYFNDFGKKIKETRLGFSQESVTVL